MCEGRAEKRIHVVTGTMWRGEITAKASSHGGEDMLQHINNGMHEESLAVQVCPMLPCTTHLASFPRWFRDHVLHVFVCLLNPEATQCHSTSQLHLGGEVGCGEYMGARCTRRKTGGGSAWTGHRGRKQQQQQQQQQQHHLAAKILGAKDTRHLGPWPRRRRASGPSLRPCAWCYLMKRSSCGDSGGGIIKTRQTRGQRKFAQRDSITQQ